MAAMLLFVIASGFVGVQQPPLLQPGEPVAGVIQASDPVVKAPGLRLFADAPVRAKTYRLRVPDPGPYHIVLRSHFFDPYLILRSERGRVLSEDDDGCFGTYPRLLLSGLLPEQTLLVQACALHGHTGKFEIRLVRGEPEKLSLKERQQAAVREERSTVAEVEKALGAKHPQFVWALGELAYDLMLQGKYDEAEAIYRRALAICDTALGPQDPVTAATLANAAELYLARKDFEEARLKSRKALEIFEKIRGPEHLQVAATLDRLGVILHAEGAYEKARPLFERALAIRRKLLGRRHPKTAESLDHLAMLLQTLGSLEEARPLLQESLRIYRRSYGPRAPRTALCLNRLGFLAKQAGDLEEARGLYERALAVSTESLGPEDDQTVSIQNNLAALLREEKKFDEARRLFERVLKIRLETHGPEHPAIATSLNSLAMLLADLHEYEEAAKLLEQAVQMTRKMFGTEHASTALYLSNLSLVDEKRGRLEEAARLEAESLAARGAILERQLPVLSESERFRWAARQRRSLDHALELALRAKSAGDTVYREVLRWKGLVSRGLLESRRWLNDHGDAKTLAAQSELGDVLAKLSAVFYDEKRAPEDRISTLESLRERRDALERKLAGTHREAAAGRGIDLPAVQAALAPGDAFLDFLVYGPDEEARLAAFIVRREGPVERVELGPAEALRRALRWHLDDVSGKRGATLVGVSTLRELLWAPLESHLRKTDRIFLCPDEELATLPFETIPGKKKVTYLIEEYAFVYVQSALDLLEPHNEHALGQGALLVGGVDYDSVGGREPGSEPGEGYPVAVRSGATRAFGRPFLPLDGTLDEVRALENLYERAKKQAPPPLVLVGADATKVRIKTEVVGKRYVHLATHGFFAAGGLPSMFDQARKESTDTSGPNVEARQRILMGLLPGLLSGLTLSGANLEDLPASQDGILTAEEVSWLDLSGCDLVTLSACETALGTPQGGEQLIGLRRALHLAGARTTVTSFWNVNDEATMELMREFYRRLWWKGQSKLEAFRGAQLTQLRGNRARYRGEGRPGTWGAFVLEGDWR